jgi:hypothetical protein
MTDHPLGPEAARAELVCSGCRSGPQPAVAGFDHACAPVVVVRLPGGRGEAEVSLGAGGQTVIVRRHAGLQCWEHEVDLPFCASLADLSWSSGDGAVELRIALRGDLVARARRPLAVAT